MIHEIIVEKRNGIRREHGLAQQMISINPWAQKDAGTGKCNITGFVEKSNRVFYTAQSKSAHVGISIDNLVFEKQVVNGHTIKARASMTIDRLS